MFRPFALVALAGLVAGFASAPVQADPGQADPWVVTGHETCTADRMVVARNVVIESGAILDLQGCILAMAAPAYVDQYFAGDEGLSMRIEKGGRFEAHSLPGRPAGLERSDARYGFTVTSYGDVLLEGLPGTPAHVFGLEGAHEAQVALGGFKVMEANVTASDVRFDHNAGPALFMRAGSALDGRNLTFRSGGIVGQGARHIHLDNVSALAGNTAVTLTLVPDATLSRCSLQTGLLGLSASFSNLTMTNCTVASNQTALRIQDSNLTLRGTTLVYGKTGVEATSKNRISKNRVVLDNVAVLGEGANATVAVQSDKGADLLASQSRFVARSGQAMNLTGGSLSVRNSQLEGLSGIRLVDASSAEVAQVKGPSPAIEVWRTTLVGVDRSGRPVPFATVALPGDEATTSDQGAALLSWRWVVADELARLPSGDAKVPLTISEAGGKTYRVEMRADSLRTTVDLDGLHNEAGLSGLAAGVAIALALASSRRSR